MLEIGVAAETVVAGDVVACPTGHERRSPPFLSALPALILQLAESQQLRHENVDMRSDGSYTVGHGNDFIAVGGHVPDLSVVADSAS
jgi:hypothetical protein